MPNILLLNDNSGQDNWGAQATPHALLRMLHEHIPNVSITAISHEALSATFRKLDIPFARSLVYSPRRGSPIARLLNRLSDHVEFFPEIADEFDFVADQWIAGNAGPLGSRFLEAAEKADVIIHNGENSIYRNTAAGIRSLFLLWFAKTRMGKPCCEINQTAMVDAMPRPIMRGMVKKTYPLLDVVTAREFASVRDLQNLGLKNVEFVPDVVFYLEQDPNAVESVATWKKGVWTR